MAPPTIPGPRTTGSTDFNPDILFLKWSQSQQTLPNTNDLRSSIIKTFSLPQNDTYIYHAIASVTLTQVQDAVNHGGEAGLHAWYRGENGNTLPPPPSSDIAAYTTIFAPSTTTTKALTGFSSNAKKSSIRHRVAAHLLAHRHLPSPSTLPPIPKCKNHINPYLDFWKWSCENLEWCGPEPYSASVVKTSHHVLPVFMHHFGCVVPSYEALEVIRWVSRGRGVVDLGSGNGYWTYMLRRHVGMMGQGQVRAVDNLQSEWRTMWIGDTIVMDGERYLREENKKMEEKKKEKEMGGQADSPVLLLVYPIVGAEFTKTVIAAYKGNTIVVAGTQNRNGYTAFKDQTIEEWMAKKMVGWEKTVQIPLPSFAGKDEAMFVFEKKSHNE